MTEREKMIKVLRDNIEYELRGYPNEHYVGVTFNYGDIVDALIAAGIGDVTALKGRAEKEKAEKNKWKCTANDWRQRFESAEKKLIEFKITSYEAHQKKDKVCREQKAEIARLTAEGSEHRAEVAERQAVVLSKWLAEKTRKDYPWRAWFDAAQKQAEREIAEERLKKLKKTEEDLTVEEEINILENLVEEAKHRSFVFERELVKHKIALATVCEEVLHARYPVEYVTVSVVEDFIQHTLKDAEKELTEEK